MDTTTPPPAGQPAPPPPAFAQQRYGSDGFFDSMRRLGVVRTQDRWIGGVAGGVALRIGIDPLLVRGIFAITALFGGAGLILYGLAWALLPEQVDGRIHLQETIRGRFDAALLGAIALFVIGISWRNGWWHNGTFNGLLWLAAVLAMIAIIVAAVRQRGANRRAAGPKAPWTGPGFPPAPGAQPYGPTPPPPAPGRGYPTPPAGYTAAPASGYTYPPAGGYAGPPAGGYAGPPADYAPVPPVPPIPPKPLKPRVYGPGRAAIRAVVGLTLLALAVLLILDRNGTLDWPVALTAAGIGIMLAGLGIAIAGFRGRRSGTLGFLAIVAIVLAVPASIADQSPWSGPSDNVRFLVSDGAWTPTTVADARKGLAVAVGDVNVDLTQLPITAGRATAVTVPISLGAGDVTVTVPSDAAVTANVRVRAGDIRWDVDPTQRISSVSDSQSYDFASSEVTARTSPELAIQIDAGAASVRVVEENR
ncbi:PspC domain-containing protein [Pengzhenrongella sp.]|jgi:phage shock protein PspC (stress-responsive transcriptional regulator)|uniref:PspC domain-containing protein n=1 Tax=Pengzhenrongella sp. TaxID=2888820 RepID=UPI002F926FA4